MSNTTRLFLTSEEIDELTGIARGRTERGPNQKEVKLTKYQLQITHLRTQAIPFFVNAAGHPVVARAAVEGRATKAEEVVAKWQPGVMKRAS